MFQNTSFLRNSAALVVCCLVGSGCAINTATYGTGETTGGGFAKDLGNIATFGLVGGGDKKEKIVYQERTALVIPSKEQFASLPQPVENSDKNRRSASEIEALERIKRAEEQAARAQRAQAAQLPFEPKKQSLFSRLGVSKVSDTARASTGALTEVPPEYRVVEQAPGTPNVDPFAKKKKKKRFLLF